MSIRRDEQTIDMAASMETEEGLAIIDALNGVSDVLAMSGPHVTFVGTRVAALAPSSSLAGVDVFSCPRGWFVLLRQPEGPHRPAAGADLDAALDAIDDDAVREHVRRELARRGLP